MCSLVEPNVKVKDGRYETPVPLRPDIVKKIPNNFSNALERTMSLRRKALCDPTSNGTFTAGLLNWRTAVPIRTFQVLKLELKLQDE